MIVDLSAKSAVEKSEYLYESGLISESEHIRVLCEQLISGDNWDGTAQCCGTTLMAEITAYAGTMSEDDPNYEIIATTAKEVTVPVEYVNGGSVYHPSSTSAFRVHYGTMLNKNGVAVSAGTLNQAKAVYDELVKIRQFFYIEAVLRAPIGHLSSTVYDVYIVHKDYYPAAGMTYSVDGGNSSFICMPLNTVEDIYDGVNSACGTLAHEYIHGVMMAYGISLYEEDVASTSTLDEVYWMHDSFASFLGCLYTIGRAYDSYNAFENTYFSNDFTYIAQSEDYASSKSRAVIDFLTTQHLALTDISDDREYGALLFPMYLYDREGSIAIFQTMLYEYQYYNDPIQTIDQHGMSFELYIDAFYSWAFQPSANMKFYDESWGMVQPYDIITRYPYSVPRTNANALSCTWRKFLAPSTGVYTINVTTSIYGYSSSTVASVLRKYQTSSGQYIGLSSKMHSSQNVSTLNKLGSSYTNFWIGFVNRGEICTYYQTATVTNTSTIVSAISVIDYQSPLLFLHAEKED